MELLQRSPAKSQDFLPRQRVSEQVLQVSQCQVWFGLHRLLDTHLSFGVVLKPKARGVLNKEQRGMKPLTSFTVIQALWCCVH